MTDINLSETPALDENGNFLDVEQMTARGYVFPNSPSELTATARLEEVPPMDLDAVGCTPAVLGRGSRVKKPIVREDPSEKLTKKFTVSKDQQKKNFQTTFQTAESRNLNDTSKTGSAPTGAKSGEQANKASKKRKPNKKGNKVCPLYA
jgi:hypothetical protein